MLRAVEAFKDTQEVRKEGEREWWKNLNADGRGNECTSVKYNNDP